jgi:hypothetical protein
MNTKDQEKAPVEYHDYLSISEATAVMGFAHAQYTRRLLHDSVAALEKGEEPKLPWPSDDRPMAVKLSMGGYDKWFIHPSTAANYEARASTVGQGLRRYLFRFNEEWMTVSQVSEAMAQLFGEQGEDTFIFEPAYKPGSRKGTGGKKEPKTAEDFTATIVSQLTKPFASARGTYEFKAGEGPVAAAAAEAAEAEAANPAAELD